MPMQGSGKIVVTVKIVATIVVIYDFPQGGFRQTPCTITRLSYAYEEMQ